MSSKKEKGLPWWHNPELDEVYITDEELYRCARKQIPNHVITRIIGAFLNNKFHTRPVKSGTRKWQENVFVDRVKIGLSCHLEVAWICITRIQLPKGAFRKAQDR